MTEPNNSSSSAATPAAPRIRTILHLSDLHFGWRFEPSKWDDLQGEAQKTKPDVVLITGDLVNTPWFWMWPRVRSKLDKFAADLRAHTGNTSLPVLVIPGNHDTRISGIFPVPWLLWTALASGMVAGLCYWLYGTAAGTHWLGIGLKGAGWAAGALACIAVALRLLVQRNLRRALGDDMLLADAKLFTDLRVGIVPFDSASSRLSWARGHITADSLVQCKIAIRREERALDAHSAPPVWIAAVHHHPLPLPYDSASEHMMVMDNAGAFLRELARHNVKLILHGHKHHQHFARIAVDPATKQRLEIAVLSAGTPTEGANPGAFRHGFNVIRVHPDDRLEVEMFEAEPNGGTFSSKPPFDVVPAEDHARAQFEFHQQSDVLWCRRMVCIADINDYGDAHFVREFRGIKTPRERITEFPAGFTASASSGSIEGYRAQTLSEHGPGVTVRLEKKERNRVIARVVFKGAGLQRGDDPLDVITEFQGNNAFALNRWQFVSMYPTREDYLESVSFRAPLAMAVEELVLYLKFPAAFGLPRRLDFRWGEGPQGAERWAPFRPRTLVRLESQNAVGASIMHPVPDAVYQINWDLEEAIPTTQDPAVEHAISSALALRAWLAGLKSPAVPAELDVVLGESEMWAREKLVRAGPVDRPLHFALFGYSALTRSLHVVASNYPADEVRRNGMFSFGQGLPGRAFKSAEAAVFTRPRDWQTGRPLGYTGDEAASESDAAARPVVPEAALLAIPLAPPEAPDWPYAVWQISSDDPEVQLHTADTPTDQTLEEVTAALQENLTYQFLSIMSQMHASAGKNP